MVEKEKEDKTTKQVVPETPPVETPDATGAAPASAGVAVIDPPPEIKAPGWHDKVKSHYPDRNFDEDGAMDKSAEELIAELSDYKAKSKEANQKLVEILTSEPSIAEFIADLMEGASVPVALARNFDLDALTPQEGEPDYDEWKTTAGDRKKKAEEGAAFDAEIATNKIESSTAFDEFAKSKGWDEAKGDAFLDKIDGFLADIYKGKVSSEFLDAMNKATDYDTDVDTAAKKAELKAKNEKIEVEKKDVKKGDGLPTVKSSGDSPEKPKKEKSFTERYVDGLQK